MILAYCAMLMVVPDTCPPPSPLSSYPAVITIYDPSRGGIKCDQDCSTVATGPLTSDMYFTSGACHPDLLGSWVYFPSIQYTMQCVDTGGLVTVRWSDHHQAQVLFFDAMWDASQPPPWNYWMLDDWRIIWP